MPPGELCDFGKYPAQCASPCLKLCERLLSRFCLNEHQQGLVDLGSLMGAQQPKTLVAKSNFRTAIPPFSMLDEATLHLLTNMPLEQSLT